MKFKEFIKANKAELVKVLIGKEILSEGEVYKVSRSELDNKTPVLVSEFDGVLIDDKAIANKYRGEDFSRNRPFVFKGTKIYTVTFGF